MKTGYGTKTYNKLHSCYFCGIEVQKIPRHFRTTHKNEPEVLRIEAMSDKELQMKEIDKCRLKGDFYHNLKVLQCGGELKSIRRPGPDEIVEYNQFRPCVYCLGFVQKHELWRHVAHCPFNEKALLDSDGTISRKLQYESEMLLNGSKEQSMDAMQNSIFSIMRQDRTSFVARNDELIVKFGYSLFEKDGSSRAAYISQKMRSLERLLEMLRTRPGKENCCLSDFITPSSFDDSVEATRELYTFSINEDNDNLASVKTPSLALKSGHSLKRCAALLRGVALRKREKDLKESVDSFLELLESEWSTKISTAALRSLSDNRFNKTPILPLTGDLIKLRELLMKEIPASTQRLLSQPTLQEWRSLVELTVARIIIFNKRRGNEGSKIQISQFTERPRWTEISMEEISLSLQPLEVELCKR